jgi:hypothetical protein
MVETGEESEPTTTSAPRLPGKWAMDLTLRHPPKFTSRVCDCFPVDVVAGYRVWVGRRRRLLWTDRAKRLSTENAQCIGSRRSGKKRSEGQIEAVLDDRLPDQRIYTKHVLFT